MLVAVVTLHVTVPPRVLTICKVSICMGIRVRLVTTYKLSTALYRTNSARQPYSTWGLQTSAQIARIQQGDVSFLIDPISIRFLGWVYLFSWS